MIDIKRMVDDLITREGGYSNNPADKGGETKYGVTVAQARAYGYAGPMANFPRPTAISIYMDIYWKVPRFDLIAQTMPKLAAELFDTGVNMGPQRASKFLQRALNVLNNKGRDYPDVDVDGQIGKMTIYAFGRFQQRRGANAEKVLLRLLEAQQAVRYMELAETNQSQEAFEYGWIANRVGDIV
jgi:lysozyme family protein